MIELIFLFVNCMMAVPDSYTSHHYNFIPCETHQPPSDAMRLLQQYHYNPPPVVQPPPVVSKTTLYVSPTEPYVPTYAPVTSNQTSDNNFNWNFLILGVIALFLVSILVIIFSRRRISLRSYDEVTHNTRISGNVRTHTTSATKTEDIRWGKALFDVMKKNYPRDWENLKDYVVEQDDDRKDIVKRDEKLRQRAKEPLYKITDDKTCPVCNTRFSSVGECAQHVRDAHESYGV